MKKLILILVSLILVGCGANPKVSSHLSIPTGSSKEFTCEQYVLIRAKFTNNALCRYDFQNKYSYFPEYKTEIITNDNIYFYVFEGVNTKVNCTFMGCSLGDGRLKLITADKTEATLAANPKLREEAEEKKKAKFLEEAREREREFALERKAVAEREEQRKKLELEALEKIYGKECAPKKNNRTEFSNCLYEKQKIEFAAKQEKERKIAKEKLELQNKLSNMAPTERYAYTCEKTYGFKKGSDNFRDCVFKIMTTEYQMQAKLNETRIKELEARIAGMERSASANASYNNQMLEIERMKAKAMQDQVNFAKNKDITDTLLGMSQSLLSPNRPSAPSSNNFMLNCQTRKFGGFDQIQCF